jgi:transmembrane sensor
MRVMNIFARSRAAAQSADDRDKRAGDEAAMWLERLERSLRADEIALLREWLKVPMHRKAIAETGRLFHGPHIMAVLDHLFPVQAFATRVRPQPGRIVLAIFLGVSGLGLSTVLIAASHLWTRTSSESSLRAEGDYRTAIGSTSTIALPDGSSMTLAPASRALVSYGPHARDVTLLRGEARFDVVSDPERSFRVHAGVRRFEVIVADTRFNLRRLDAERIELHVRDGEVTALDSRRSGPLPPALLRARASSGEHLFIAGESGVLGAGWQLTSALKSERWTEVSLR